MKIGTRVLACVSVSVLACVAGAQYGATYEDFDASASGVPLDGQFGYYVPVASSASITFNVHTYLGNPLGIPANPTGGQKFVGGLGPGSDPGVATYCRTELVEEGMYGDGTGVWTVSYDIAAAFNGTLPTAQNLGSWSTQVDPDPLNPTVAGFIALAQWTDPATAESWDANYIAYDASGTYIYPAVVDDPAFQGLVTGHWYRWSTTFDLDTNMITEVAITDVMTGETTTNNPTGWYLGGGEAGGLDAPTGFRYFAGTSTVSGNTLGFDNMSVVPEPGVLSLLVLAGCVALRRR